MADRLCYFAICYFHYLFQLLNYCPKVTCPEILRSIGVQQKTTTLVLPIFVSLFVVLIRDRFLHIEEIDLNITVNVVIV